MQDWAQILAELETEGIIAEPGATPTPVGGGDISAAWRLVTNSGAVFLKTGDIGDVGLLEAEAEGLVAIAETATVRVPRVLAHGCDGDTAWLALDWLVFGRTGGDVERRLGEQLAAMHRHTADRHGWHRDNWIGRTPQPNAWHEDWVAFFAGNRLEHQLRLAAGNGFGGELQTLGMRLVGRLADYFEGYTPAASLLHGDLWGGNWASVDREPVIYDPAVYYGDREADLAMTRLFGGFGAAFYAAYENAWPLAPGHEARDAIYRLYHVLNHLNLFGGGYLSQALSLLRRLA